MTKLTHVTLALALLASLTLSAAVLVITPLGLYRWLKDTPSCTVKKGIIL
jgi:hypothetical protein